MHNLKGEDESLVPSCILPHDSASYNTPHLGDFKELCKSFWQIIEPEGGLGRCWK